MLSTGKNRIELMGSDANTRFRLSVWRPAQLGRRLDYAHNSGNSAKDATATRGFETSRLHEEIYHWHPGQEDVWGCILDPAVTNSVRDMLIEGFAPSLPPDNRLMTKFREVVEGVKSALAQPEATSWADTGQMVPIDRDESANLRANSAISLVHHLEWIVRTFGSVPGASVAIR